MKWVKFRIKTVTDAEDIIISTLYDLGLEGAQIEDKVPLTAMEKEQMFVDILPDGPEDDGIAYLSFFVEEKEDGSLEVAGEKTTTEAVLADVKQEFPCIEYRPEFCASVLTIEYGITFFENHLFVFRTLTCSNDLTTLWFLFCRIRDNNSTYFFFSWCRKYQHSVC